MTSSEVIFICYDVSMHADYSIECALPYDDDFESKRQQFELAFTGLVRGVAEADKTFARTLLVDDVTGESNTDLDAYTSASANEDSVVFRESMLNEQAEDLVAELSQSDAELASRHQVGDSFSSPMYIAVWMLIRLGKISHPDFPPEKIADSIVNILPADWREGEDESLSIIKATVHAEASEKIENIYL